MLRQLVRLFDQVERGDFVRSGELRLFADTLGVSPKGQQDRRWLRPVQEVAPVPEQAKVASAYSHLRAVK